MYQLVNPYIPTITYDVKKIALPRKGLRGADSNEEIMAWQNNIAECGHYNSVNNIYVCIMNTCKLLYVR